MRPCLRAVALAWAVGAATPSPGAEPLTEIRRIARLARDAAAMQLPVRVRAVVTYADPGDGHFFVQSGRDGIAVWDPERRSPVARGDLVEIEGVTAAGAFAPRIAFPSSVRRVGRAPLPEAAPLTLSDFVSGAYHTRFMKVGGVVRAAHLEGGRAVALLATPFGRARLVMPLRDPAPLVRLVGAEVEVRGALATDVNRRGQLAGLRIHALDLADVRVVVPPVPLEDVPYRVLSDLARYDPGAQALGRVRTRGVVTFRRADGALFVQEGGHVAIVRAEAPAAVQVAVGEPVEAVGFATVSDGMLLVEDALLGPGPTLRPLEPLEVTTAGELASEALDGRLVRIRAEARFATRHSAEVVFTTRLPGGNGFLEVRLPVAEGGGLVETVHPGAQVEFTGVKLPLVSSSLGTRWPVVMARSAADVVIRRPPPFWTVPRVAALAGGLLLALVLVALAARWRVRGLERTSAALAARVEERTRDLAEANARLRESDVMRTRLLRMAAHDLRSPLGVVLANATHALSLTPPTGALHETCEDIVAAAGRMEQLLAAFLSRERIETPAAPVRASRLDLARCVAALPERLGGAARRKRQRIEPELPAEPAWVEADPTLVTHVLDNLVDNALKFSPPGTTVRAALRCVAGQARICVADEGPGLSAEDLSRLFVPGQRLSARPTGGEPSAGIGLSLAKAWVEAMGGTIWAERAEGGGAAFWVALPLREPSRRPHESPGAPGTRMTPPPS